MNKWAKETGFLKRKGKLSPYKFIILMVIGQLGMKHPSLGGMVTAIRSKISREALHSRFSGGAVAFLYKCLCFVLRQKIDRNGKIDTKLLNPFKRVLIVDSSSWGVNEKLRKVFPGSGGSASRANCKLQTVYDYKHSQLCFMETTGGTIPDNRYTDHLPDLVEKDDLLLFDLGYYKTATLRNIAAKKAFFLSRFLVGVTVRDPITKASIDLARHLNALQANTCELNILIGNHTRNNIICRLVAFRVNDKVANKRRRRLRKSAKAKGQTASAYRLILCDWTLITTNVPQEILPPEMARAMYTIRWQVELFFKQIKSILQVHCSNTSKKNRLLCELYGKLIGAVIIHQIHALETNQLWNRHHREVSMDKLYKRIQERSFHLFDELLSSIRKGIIYLKDLINIILPNCLKNKQLSRMTTLETIEAQFDPLLFSRKFTP